MDFSVEVALKANGSPTPSAAWEALKSRIGHGDDHPPGETGLFPEPAEIGHDCSCPIGPGCASTSPRRSMWPGARLDANPEMLFALPAADHLELIIEVTES
jgi:hypothetical protein